MKFGVVIPSWLYAQERVDWARRSFESLSRTEQPSQRPMLLFVVKRGIVPFRDVFPVADMTTFADFSIVNEPEGVQGGCSALAWGFDFLLERSRDVTHVLFVGDDFIHHPSWLRQQEALIERHPSAISTYVYRSNNTRHHRTIREEGEDCLVTNISGPGCFSREEWRGWGQTYRDFPRPDGCTLDILHERQRPGERWVTRSSYLQQIGVRGMHNNSGECDEAIDFVGDCNVAVGVV